MQMLRRGDKVRERERASEPEKITSLTHRMQSVLFDYVWEGLGFGHIVSSLAFACQWNSKPFMHKYSVVFEIPSLHSAKESRQYEVFKVLTSGVSRL